VNAIVIAATYIHRRRSHRHWSGNSGSKSTPAKHYNSVIHLSFYTFTLKHYQQDRVCVFGWVILLVFMAVFL